MSGVTATPPKPLCAHCLVPAVFWTPTYCCVCAGIIPWPGGGYKCSNAGCSMTVHRWIGHGEHENCRAEALLTHCPDNRAIKNDWNSTIEEQVVKGIVDKQRKLGKLDALTEKVKGITWLWGAYGGVCRARGDILKYIAIAGSVFGLSTTAVVFLACTLYMNNFSNKAALAVSSAQAASNVMTLFSVLALLLLLARHGSMKLLLRAKLIKAWIGSIVFIDLDEIGVDVEAIARVGLELSGHGAAVAGGGFVIALAVWLKAVATM